MPSTENHVLKEVPLEASLYEELRRTFPQVVDVHYPPAGSNGFLTVVAVRSTGPRDARNIVLAVLGSRKRGKYNVVVDDDVDIFDMEQVVHAACTRSEPAEDTIVVPDVSPVALDPAAHDGQASVLGLNATRPLGRWFPTQVERRPWPRLDELLKRRGG
jgi:4-hydroxy-3-polyprenylbenzoate decarboxylase/2,5-furandicarboxylate decarboxylase 1